MNTLTSSTGYSSRIATAPRAVLRPVPQAATGSLAVAGLAVRASWLERLACWYERQPRHRRLGSYTMMV
jgi:hypothetical protein